MEECAGLILVLILPLLVTCFFHIWPTQGPAQFSFQFGLVCNEVGASCKQAPPAEKTVHEACKVEALFQRLWRRRDARGCQQREDPWLVEH